MLCRLGTVILFNPEDNRPLPEGTDLLYLPGGYPEKHYEKLRQAWQRMQSIRNYAESGGRVLAECGGMIYLSKGILLDRSEHSDSEVGLQAGVLPFFISNRKADRRLIITANIFADTSFTIHNSSRNRKSHWNLSLRYTMPRECLSVHLCSDIKT